jgi:hypothetical protein
MSSEVAVYVAVGDRNLLAGRLYPHRRRGVESASFGYDDRYLADPDSYALDPALPLVTGSLQPSASRARSRSKATWRRRRPRSTPVAFDCVISRISSA